MKALIVLIFCVFSIILVLLALYHPFTHLTPHSNQPLMTIDGKTFALKVAVTEKDQEKGLGYRSYLPLMKVCYLSLLNHLTLDSG